MNQSTTESFAFPPADARDVLQEVLREGAQRMLAFAVQAEADLW